MCGSFYTLRGRIGYIRMMFPDDIAEELIEKLIEKYRNNPPERRNVPWPQNYYVRPTNSVLVFVGTPEAEIEPVELKWGHAPKRYRSKQPLFNARGETLDEKATWHEPWHSGRCVIPAGGFFEWVNRQPHAVQNTNGLPMLLAGLWRRDDDVDWCSIVTCEPSTWFRQYHHREPVILREADWQRWLFDEDPPEDLIHPSAAGELEIFACASPSRDSEPGPLEQTRELFD